MPTATHPTTSTTTRALEVLHENVERIRNGDEWRRALEFRSRFHKYSFSNAFLIALQHPSATMVAGYRKWQELGRQVRKGEKSIGILAPMTRKIRDEADEERIVVTGFRTASVFDVSQTDGPEIPDVPRPTLLNGDDEAAIRMLLHAEGFARDLGLKVAYVPQGELHGAMGSYPPATGWIRVREDVSPKQQLKTLVHEIAHGILHSKIDDRQSHSLIELEAESAAYLVADGLGLDTSAYSFHYVAHYAVDAELLLKSGDAAVKAADQILAALTAPRGNA